MQQPEFDALVAESCSVPITDPHLPLVDQGVDSLATLTLLLAVEEKFGIEIDPDALGGGQLDTTAGLLAYVNDALAARTSA